ncbi:hypothetical protein ACISRB_31405, partial [Micromonospora aurantiaca]
HTIALTRRRIHPETRDYITRRHAEGRTTREITRCLKRYIARQLYRTITTHHQTPRQPHSQIDGERGGVGEGQGVGAPV